MITAALGRPLPRITIPAMKHDKHSLRIRKSHAELVPRFSNPAVSSLIPDSPAPLRTHGSGVAPLPSCGGVVVIGNLAPAAQRFGAFVFVHGAVVVRLFAEFYTFSLRPR